LCGIYKAGIDKIIEILSVNKPKAEFIPQIGIEMIPKKMILPGGFTSVINIWNIKELNIGNTINETFFRGSLGAIFVFDHMNIDSFNALDSWFSAFREYNKESPFILIGTQSSAPNLIVSKDQAREWAEKKNGSYYGMDVISMNTIEDVILLLLKRAIK